MANDQCVNSYTIATQPYMIVSLDVFCIQVLVFQVLTLICLGYISLHVLIIFPYRNVGQGRIAPLVSEKDCPLQECQCSKLPHEVCMCVCVCVHVCACVCLFFMVTIK